MVSEGLPDGINHILLATFIFLERKPRWSDGCKTLSIDFVGTSGICGAYRLNFRARGVAVKSDSCAVFIGANMFRRLSENGNCNYLL
jgi:hypothetical protein